jgi:hypothetical protein
MTLRSEVTKEMCFLKTGSALKTQPFPFKLLELEWLERGMAMQSCEEEDLGRGRGRSKARFFCSASAAAPAVVLAALAVVCPMLSLPKKLMTMEGE